MDKSILFEPLKQFYQRLLNDYGIGNKNVYTQDTFTSMEKYCFNPFFSTEADIQVKLGGYIEEYFLKNKLPYSVNAEMKIYDEHVKNQRCDLTIHSISPSLLYTERDSHKKTLQSAIEIKYANALHPDYEFKTGQIHADLNKLSSLDRTVQKYFVFIDEADRLTVENAQWLHQQCQSEDIQLFTNNRKINYWQGFPYGFRQVLVLTQEKTPTNTEYIFGDKAVFLQKIHDYFHVTKLTETYLEIQLDSDTKLELFYAKEDDSLESITGNCFVDVQSNAPIHPNSIRKTFQEVLTEFTAEIVELEGNQ